MSQEIIESDAHAAYLGTKRLLHGVAYLVTASQTEDHPLNHCSRVPRLL
jgi:hypothetical protein